MCVQERQTGRQENIPGCSQNHCVGEDAFKFVILPPFYHVGTKRTEPRALCVGKHCINLAIVHSLGILNLTIFKLHFKKKLWKDVNVPWCAYGGHRTASEAGLSFLLPYVGHRTALEDGLSYGSCGLSSGPQAGQEVTSFHQSLNNFADPESYVFNKLYIIKF